MVDRNSALSETLHNLRQQQQQAWRQGERLFVESLISKVATRLSDNELHDLIVTEVTLRQELGETCTSVEYIQRFPQLAEALQRLFVQNGGDDSHSAETNSFIAGDTGKSQSTINPIKRDPVAAPEEKNTLKQAPAPAPAKDPAETDSRVVADPFATVTYINISGIGVQTKGRYRLDRILGEGAFGQVYLGFDTELQRQVAIKVPTFARFQKPEDAEAYLDEARTVAALDHPNIVSVYDMGRTEDGSIYVVSKFVDGSTLQDRINAGRATEQESARLLATVALALAYAHQKRLIHRDIKPANILIENSSNTPFVADFGLAVREEDYLKQSVVAGTPAYMSPEQIRGEGHRLDGRSDIFSLGVILYEMLTTKRPFRGSSMHETLHLVLNQDPRPPRELFATIPAELERICLKALSKRASDRYANAADFAEDLEQWLKPTAASSPTKAAAQVVPKGLRSFDANDAYFFLQLLPGQRNRDGLPESIAFWKQRIEQTDPEQTFSVGLIYGPSGCGKSSLVKAGLLPNLSKDVVAVYLEATPDETETRILRGLEKRLAELSKCQNLTDKLASLRRGQGGAKKVVIIIDQFEQWLHAHRPDPDCELVKALRQCDGGRVQAILMIRDDFYVAALRLMQALDIDVVPGRNFLLVDLFDVDHARNVLIRFGQAFGKLPANAANLSAEEEQFISTVASGLAQDGKVVSVRLSLLAEMVKGKPWKPETLEQVGGTQGIGVNFLEETFASVHADPRFRRHSVATRGILRALLPDLDTDIKGGMRSHAELLSASDYQDRPTDFNDLLRILDGELRLITPTDPEGTPIGEPDASASGSFVSRSGTSGANANNPPAHAGGAPRYYQLTHDYLVPSLREWLTRKQKETRRGRAELKLEERTALWTAKPENRHLPSLREWIGIRWLTEAKQWTAAQRSVMNRAARVHGLRTGITVLGIGLIIAAALGLDRQADERRNQAEATRLVEGLLAANTAKVSDSLASLKPFRRWADVQLQQEFQEAAPEADAKLHAGLALLSNGNQVDPALLKYLQERLLTVSPAQISPVRELMVPQKSELIPAYWTLAKDTAQPAALRFRAACALAGFDANSAEWKNPEWTDLVADQLVTVSPEYIGEFKELLRPVATKLVPALTTIFQDPNRGELAKTLTTSLLVDYAANDSDTLTALVLAADVVSDKTLFPVLQQHQTTAVKNLEAVLDVRLECDWKDAPLDPTWTEPSPAIRAQIESAHGMITDRFAFCQNMPLGKFLELAETLRASGYRPTRVRPHLSLLPMAGGEGGRRSDEGVADLAATSVVAGLPTVPPSPTADLPSTGGVGRPAVEGSAGSGDPRTTLMSAIWTRDNKRWNIDPSLKSSDFPGPDAPTSKDGLLLADICPLPTTDDKAEPDFIALWSEPANAEEQRRILFDLTEAELTAAQTALRQEGFTSQSTITVRTDSSGQRRYTGIWSNQGAPSELRTAYAGFELVHQPQWDVAVAPAGKLADPLETFRKQKAQIEQLPAEKMDEPQIRLTLATAFYQLGNLEAALDDLDFLISKEIVTSNVLQYRTLTLARLGKVDEAEESLTKYMATDAPPSFKLYVQIQVPAWLGDFDQASTKLESAVSLATAQNNDELYNVACAAALCSQGLSGKDATQAEKFADRTFELLRQLMTRGYTNANQLKSNADFASLHGDHRFVELLSQLEPPATYAALWQADVQYESKLLTAVPTTSVADQLKPMLVEGWRPFAIAVDSSRGAPVEAGLPTEPPLPIAGLPSSSGQRDAGRRPVKSSAGSEDPRKKGTQPLCSLVLHRPLIPDPKKESLSLQQAAAATALLRLNAAEKVWPLFQDQPDPRLRSHVLHRLATYGVDPQSLFTQLQQESETSRQRSLILGLGEFAKARLMAPEQMQSMTADLAKHYADDPDPGIHGAAEWTLRQLGAEAAIAEVRTAYSTGTAVGDRRWYITKTGAKKLAASPLSFAILDASDEFLMGSPVSETDRFLGPTGNSEIRHRRKIGRRFAIGTHEVTVAQFKAFRRDHQFDRAKAREEDSPANFLTWYDAAAYCNWLSDQEGLPRDQWCYDPEQAFEEGMTLLPDYLQRTGYRLPSEAEWEYACRMGTTTARYFGETETLLGEYAWYVKTSGEKWMLPVGTLRPNGAGLFDMQGNVVEWCQDSVISYGTDRAMMSDIEQTGKLSDSGSYVLRGGSFIVFAAKVRAAFRNTIRPYIRNNTYGLRVARTYP